ncbi:MAG: hypothetical protein ACOZBH_02540 [Patescibacteria group bacterium]
MVEKFESENIDLAALLDAYIARYVKGEVSQERLAELKAKWQEAAKLTLAELEAKKVIDLELVKMVKFINQSDRPSAPRPAGAAALEVPGEFSVSPKKKAA